MFELVTAVFCNDIQINLLAERGFIIFLPAGSNKARTVIALKTLKTHHYFFSCEAEVWTDDQFFCTQRTTLFEFGSQEYAYAAQQLKLMFGNIDLWKDPVHIIDC